MANKNFAVVVLPKGNQTKTIEIPQENIKGSWIDAFELLENIVFEHIGKRPQLPRNKDPYSIDTGLHLVQIWIIDNPPFKK